MEKVVDTLLIDWSVVASQAINRVTGKEYAQNELNNKGRKVGQDHMLEVRYQVARTVSMLNEALKPNRIIFAIDSKPYWRNAIVKDYYEANISFLWNPYEGEWLAEVESKYHYGKYSLELQKWEVYPMSKEKFKTLAEVETFNDLLGNQKWFYFQKGILTEEDTVRLAAAFQQPTVARELSKYAGFVQGFATMYEQFYHQYKGKRVWNHDSIITKEDFGRDMKSTAKALAGIFTGEVISVETAEADDVLAHYCSMKPSEEVVAIYTGDKDIAQLVAHYENIHIFTRNGAWKVNDGNHTSGLEVVYHETTKEKEYYNFLLKLVGGDDSDKIKGVRKIGKPLTAPLTDNTGDKWLSQYRHNWETNSVKHLDPLSLAKNTTLVDLRNQPEELKKSLSMAISCSDVVTPIPLSDGIVPCLKDFGILETDEVEIEGFAEGSNPLYYALVHGKELPVYVEPVAVEVIPTAPVAPVAPAIATYVITVQAHPTNTQYPSWSAGTYQALSADAAMEMVKQAIPDHAHLFNKNGNDWYWWECLIKIEGVV